MLCVLLAVWLGSSLAAGGADTAQRRRLPPGAALIGQVVDAQSSRGLDRVIVDLAGAGVRRRIVSDDRGRFLLAGLPTGEYRITTSRTGLLDGAFGQRRAGGPASTITVVDGQWLSDIEIRMWRPGVVTGFVTDHSGDPLVGVTVRGYRLDRRPGHTALREVAHAVTDDTGAYRLAGLVPGPHLVGISAQPEALPGDNGGDPATAASPEWVFAPTYFPSADSAITAAPVTAESGRDITGISFSLPTLPLLEISGRVDPNAVPEGQMGAVQLLLARPLEPLVAESPVHRHVASVRPDADGRFTFTRVPSGRYVIEASLLRATSDDPAVTDAPLRLWDHQPVTVDERNVEDVRVTLQRGLDVEGRTRMTSLMPRAAPQPGALQIAFAPLFEAPDVRPQVLRAAADGTFRTGPVLVPGRYLVTVSGVPPGWRLQSVMAGGIDVSDEGLDLSSGFVPSDLQIELTDQLTLITGTVRGVGALADPAASVLLFPQQDRTVGTLGSRRYHSVRAASDGTFSLRNMPAGAYLIVAIDDAHAEGWQDPDRLAILRRTATPVSIREGEAKILELRRTGPR